MDLGLWSQSRNGRGRHPTGRCEGEGGRGEPASRAGAKPCKPMHAARLAGSRPADTRRTSQIDDIPQIIEEAANFCVSLFRDSRVTQVTRGPNGAAFVIEFELAGIQYIA